MPWNGWSRRSSGTFSAIGIPHLRGEERARYAGRRTLVVGSGHSAFHSVLELARLGEEAPGSEVTWAVRGAEPGRMFGGEGRDALPARGRLGARLRAVVGTGRVRLVTGFRVARIEGSGGRLHVAGEYGTRLGPMDQIVVNTGFRPDLGLLRELRVDLDPWLEAPADLRPLRSWRPSSIPTSTVAGPSRPTDTTPWSTRSRTSSWWG